MSQMFVESVSSVMEQRNRQTHFVFTFNSPVLPSVVKIGFMQVKVDVYIPNPLRCYQCQVFASTAVCLSIAQLASVKDQPSV